MSEGQLLICVPEGAGKQQLLNIERAVVGSCSNMEIKNVEYCYTVSEFKGMVDRGTISYYSLIFIVDRLDGGGGYIEYIPRTDGNKGRYIVMCPNDVAGGTGLQMLFSLGIYNAIFIKDMESSLERIISYPRTAEEAMVYYHINNTLDPTRFAGSGYGYYSPAEAFKEYDANNFNSEKENKKGEYVVKERELKGGITAARMITRVSKAYLGLTQMDADDELAAFLDEDVNLDVVHKKEDEIYEFPLDPDYVVMGVERLKQYYQTEGLALFQRFNNGRITKEEFSLDVERIIGRFGLKGEKAEEVFEGFLRETVSYGVLDRVIDEEGVSDIRLLNKDTVNVMYHGVWKKSNITFPSDDEYSKLIARICTKNRKSINVVSANTIYSDIDTNENAILRFAVSHESVETDRLRKMHIRKVDKYKKSANKLIAEGLMTEHQARFLATAAKSKKSIILCGGSGSGKTIVLNTLIEYLPSNICGIVVQEAEELFSKTHGNIEFQHCVSNVGESKVEHTLEELARQGLLKNSEMFCIGEIKGEEAASILSAANTGAMCLTTTHSNSCFEAITRIAQLAATNGAYTGDELVKRLARCVDYVVYLEKYQIKQIASVVGWNEEYQDVEYDLLTFPDVRDENIS